MKKISQMIMNTITNTGVAGRHDFSKNAAAEKLSYLLSKLEKTDENGEAARKLLKLLAAKSSAGMKVDKSNPGKFELDFKNVDPNDFSYVVHGDKLHFLGVSKRNPSKGIWKNHKIYYVIDGVKSLEGVEIKQIGTSFVVQKKEMK